MYLFWCDCCAFSWGTCGFPRRVLQLVTLLGFRTYLAPVCWSTPAVEPCGWVGGVLIHHLFFYLVPAQLPYPLLTLRGFCNISGSGLLVYSCGGALLLGWGCLCCDTWFSTMCRALPPGPAACAAYPAAGSLGDFQVTRCLSFYFPGDIGWAQPFPSYLCFSCSGWLAGVRWLLHPVSRCSRLGGGGLLLGRQCRHPAGFPLP